MAAPNARRRRLQDEFSPRACAALVAVADLVTAVVMWARLLLAAEEGRRGELAGAHDPFAAAHLPPRWQVQAFMAWLFLLQTPVPALLLCAAHKERLRSAELWLKLSVMLPLLLMADLIVTVSGCVADHKFSPAEGVFVLLLGANLGRAQLSRCFVTRFCRSLCAGASLTVRLRPLHAGRAASRALYRAHYSPTRATPRHHAAHAAAHASASATASADSLTPASAASSAAARPVSPATQLAPPAPPPLPTSEPVPFTAGGTAASAAAAAESPPSYAALFPHGPPAPPPPPPPPPPLPPFPPPDSPT